ncbi:polysaccharide biosynthesis/export family protein [Devosia sp. Naph2]|uniref:polysaccharide biosynthesis/export family protein n=1 Tax=Devosia polycyclovorans TaxID=3345148 RepID=UPI0035CF9CDD
MVQPRAVLTARFAWLYLFAGLACPILVGIAAPCAQENSPTGYRLSIADEIHIRIIEWNASALNFEEWTAISGNYRVGPEGTFAFPFLGDIAAEGISTGAVETAVGEGLQNVLGLATAPNVTVEVSAFGPIFITGDVTSPGQYAFTPGMTIIKAMSLAGRRTNVDEGARLEREAISTQGTLDVLESSYRRLLARRARIVAEVAGDNAIAVPETFETGEKSDLIAAEQAIMEAHLLRHSMSLETLESQRALLTRELDALAQKRETTVRQLSSAQQQLDAIASLADQGLAVNSRVTSLESSVADIDGRLLDIDTAILRARQDLGAIEQREVELSSTRGANLAVELQQVERELAELDLRIGTQQDLMRDVIAQGATPPRAREEAVYRFTIVRGAEEIAADDTTPLRPGDVVVARLEP